MNRYLLIAIAAAFPVAAQTTLPAIPGFVLCTAPQTPNSIRVQITDAANPTGLCAEVQPDLAAALAVASQAPVVLGAQSPTSRNPQTGAPVGGSPGVKVVITPEFRLLLDMQRDAAAWIRAVQTVASAPILSVAQTQAQAAAQQASAAAQAAAVLQQAAIQAWAIQQAAAQAAAAPQQ